MKRLIFIIDIKKILRYLQKWDSKYFCFSIAWTRIFPTGEEKTPNKAGLEFYDNVINECLKYGIEPLVTISHYEVPFALTQKYKGGLLER